MTAEELAALGETGAMDMFGSAGTAIPGSYGADVAALGSAESSLYGPELLANPSNALGPALPNTNALGQLYGRTAITAAQQAGNRRFDPFAFVPAVAAGTNAPWWVAPGVGAGKFAYDVNQFYGSQPQQQQPAPKAYNPQNFGNLRNYGGVAPNDYAKVANPDTQPVATSFADGSYYGSGNRG
jgi:hypothetical protein